LKLKFHAGIQLGVWEMSHTVVATTDDQL
jgi:hypothetical protein